MMTFPTLDAISQDSGMDLSAKLHGHALLVWLRDQHPTVFWKPLALKTTTVAAVLKVRRATASRLIRVLVERGYLDDCGRLPLTHVRLVQLPFDRRCIPNRTGQQAA